MNFWQEELPQRSFSQIDGDEVRLIAKFVPQGKRALSVAERRSLFLAYFRDAVVAGFATHDDARTLAEIFASCATRMRPGDTAGYKAVTNPTDWIRSVWINHRDGKKKAKVSPEDRRRIEELFEAPTPSPEPQRGNLAVAAAIGRRC